MPFSQVFRFFIKTRAVAPPSAIAALVESSPLKPISATSPSSSLAMSRSSSRSTNVTTPIEGSGTEHVLIVEDNLINQTVLKRQLIKAGLSCNGESSIPTFCDSRTYLGIVASNGLEALNIIRETHRQHRRGGPNRKRLFDVVLMDLEMPVMDGITAVQEIRGSEAAGTLGRNMVIALTGNARQGQIDHALASGFDDGESEILVLFVPGGRCGLWTILTFECSRHQTIYPGGFVEKDQIYES